jgi:hypothetical protein
MHEPLNNYAPPSTPPAQWCRCCVDRVRHGCSIIAMNVFNSRAMHSFLTHPPRTIHFKTGTNWVKRLPMDALCARLAPNCLVLIVMRENFKRASPSVFKPSYARIRMNIDQALTAQLLKQVRKRLCDKRLQSVSIRFDCRLIRTSTHQCEMTPRLEGIKTTDCELVRRDLISSNVQCFKSFGSRRSKKKKRT